MTETTYSTSQEPLNSMSSTSSPAENGPIGLIVLWRILRRGIWRILIPAILFAAIAVFLTLRNSSTYSSETQVLLTRGNLDIIEFDGGDRTTLNSGAVTNAMTILTSRNLALEVAERLDLANDPEINPNLAPPPTEPAQPSLLERIMFWQEPAPVEPVIYSDVEIRQLTLDWLAGSTLLNVTPGVNVINIRATTNDPAKSARVANTYAEVFLDRQASFGQQEAQRASDALAERIGELRVQLEDDQNALQSFDGNAENISAEGFRALVSEASRVRSRLEDLTQDMSDLDGALTQLSSVPTSDGTALRTTIDTNPALQTLEASAFGTRLDGAQLVTQLPLLLATGREEIARNNRLASALTDTLQTLDAQIQDNNETNVIRRQLEVEVETSSQVYETSLARFKELVLQTGLRDAGAQILAVAEAPLDRDGQGRKRTVIIAFILGLLLGIAYVLIREAANETIRKTSELMEATGRNSVVQLANLPRGLFRRPMARNPALKKGVAPFFDGVRSIRQMIMRDVPTNAKNLTVGVFSSLSGEGKTTVSISLARSFVMIDKRVLLIDADMRKGDIKRELRVMGKPDGLQEIVSNDLAPEEAIKTFDDLGFDVLISGQHLMNPADLVDSVAYAKLFKTLKKTYDVIIIDTPPLLVAPEGRTIVSQVDHHVFVATHNQSPRAAVRDAVSILNETDVTKFVAALFKAPGAHGYQYGRRSKAYSYYKT